MRSLYLRVWLTVVVVLALFALGSAWLFQRQVQAERGRFDALAAERIAAWGDLIERSLPGADAPPSEQAQALREWSSRLRLPLALDDASGRRISSSELFDSRAAAKAPSTIYPIVLEDGRTLWLMRPQRRPGLHGGRNDLAPALLPFGAPNWARGTGLIALLGLLFVAIAIGAFPVVRRLTRRLEALRQGVERFGAGSLHLRVDARGRDEVAAVAASFNRAAARIEALVAAHQSLLANASHELRSPLARLKMAVSLLADAAAEQRPALRREIDTNIRELDALVDEVLLASRLDARTPCEPFQSVDWLGLVAEEAARVGATLDGVAMQIQGDERLLRRAVRNLLENARRYGGGEITVQLQRRDHLACLRVCDRGPGVPEALRERIFEPFFRVPGHAEGAGGVGLGLSLVRQIAQRHGGAVRCEARAGGGSCFVLSLPTSAPSAPPDAGTSGSTPAAA